MAAEIIVTGIGLVAIVLLIMQAATHFLDSGEGNDD